MRHLRVLSRIALGASVPIFLFFITCSADKDAPSVSESGRLSLPQIFVYDLPHEFEKDIITKFPTCSTHQWAFEVFLPKLLRKSMGAVSPDSADFFLVPFPVKCFNNFVAHHNKEVVDKTYTSLLNWVKNTHPWFDISGGNDHIFIFPSGLGARIFPSAQQYLPRSIFLVAEGDRSRNDTTSANQIVVPGYSTVPRRDYVHSDRPILGYFRGNIVGNVATHSGEKVPMNHTLRISLMNELQHRQEFIFSDKKSKTYHDELSKVKFVICPRGITPWTRRVFDALLSAAVPVIISDDAEFPFESEVDWSLFTVKIAEADAIKPGFIVNKLQNLVDSRRYHIKLAEGQRYRHLFDWSDGTHVLNSILVQLGHRRRVFKHGSKRTWD